VQCIRELGEAQVEHFQVMDPDIHGYLRYFIGKDAEAKRWQKDFARKHHIYEASRDLALDCELPDSVIRIRFASRTDRVGQVIGRLTVSDKDRTVIRDVPFVSHAPEVERVRLIGKGSWLRLVFRVRTPDDAFVEHEMDFCGSAIDTSAIETLATKRSGSAVGCR
jgi:hypothetical protein